VRRARLLSFAGAATALALLAGACSGSDLVTDPPNVVATPTTVAAPPAPKLAGLAGTSPVTDVSSAFLARLHEVDPTLSETRFAAQAYDLVIILALAAEVARTDAPTRFASQIPGITSGGTRCTTYDGCRKQSDQEEDLDFEGQTGPIQMLPNGDPGEALYSAARFSTDGTLDRLPNLSARASTNSPVVAPQPDPATGPRPDGKLTIGMILDRSGPEMSVARAQRAGIQVAVKEINDGGGVLGEPMKLLDNDAGGTDSAVATASVASQLSEGVDAIIGPTTSAGTAAIMGQVTGAGVILGSASASASGLGANGNGLFFRTVPSDSLQASALAGLVAGDGHLNPTVVTENTPFGAVAALEVTARLEKLGAKVDSSIVIDPEAVPSDLLARVKAAAGDSVIFLGANSSTAAYMKGMLAAGAKPTSPAWYVFDIGPTLGVAVG